jgi:hypothetical protein
LFSHLRLGLPSCLLLSGFPTKHFLHFISHHLIINSHNFIETFNVYHRHSTELHLLLLSWRQNCRTTPFSRFSIYRCHAIYCLRSYKIAHGAQSELYGSIKLVIVIKSELYIRGLY